MLNAKYAFLCVEGLYCAGLFLFASKPDLLLSMS